MQLYIGLKFRNTAMQEYEMKVLRIDKDKNIVTVTISRPEPGSDIWVEDWNLQHTVWGFERGQYYQSEFFTLNQEVVFNGKSDLENNKIYVDAMNVVTTALAADKSLNSMYYDWRANIAKAIYDALLAKFPLMQESIKTDMHEACNEGAISFLEGLTRKVETVPAKSMCANIKPVFWPGFNHNHPTKAGQYEVVHSCGTKSVQYWNGGSWNCEYAIEGWRELSDNTQ